MDQTQHESQPPQLLGQSQQAAAEQLGNGSGHKQQGSSFMCRQTSTRWTPTSDQIRILKDLYYNNGVRSPNAEQIQKISATLRQYGKIEGKNVFYWFQNHKARERQKKRFTVDHIPTPTIPMQQQPRVGSSAATLNNVGWKQQPDHHQHHHQLDILTTNNNNHNNSNTKYTTSNMSPGVSCPSSPSSYGVLGAAGQLGCNGYGSLLMEKSFRDCSISAGGSSVVGPLTSNHGWGTGNIDPAAYTSSNSSPLPLPSPANPYPFFNKAKSSSSSVQMFMRDHHEPPQMETLPLFPMRGNVDEENISGFCTGNFFGDESGYSSSGSWYRSAHDHEMGRTSLELSLNSYCTGMSTDAD